MPKVEIKALALPNRYGETREAVVVLLDGVKIGRGHYGGEPEDNSRSRDYGWVEGLLETLATKLGAEVSSSYEEVDADRYEEELY